MNKLRKVIFTYGRNDIFDYYIIDEKENAIEKEIDEESLAFKIGGKGKYKVSKYGEIVFGNFDYLLEKRRKNSTTFCGYSLASKDEIE